MAYIERTRKRRWLWGLVFTGLLAIVLFGDVWLSKLVFYRLCAIEGGAEVQRVVDGVESILLDQGRNSGCESTCMWLLGTHGYRSIEVSVNQPASEFLTSTSGTYRFYLAERDRKDCAEYERWLEGNESFRGSIERRFGIPTSMCIASLRVKEPASTYVYRSAWQYGYVSALRIDKVESTVTERGSGNVIAKSVGFSRLRASGWLGRMFSGVDSGNESCDLPNGTLPLKTLKSIERK
jgi:hypothetical protein